METVKKSAQEEPPAKQNREASKAVIVGPTSSGKTSAAVSVCKKTGGVILSADSRQVYKELNISSGKEGKKGKFKISGLNEKEVRFLDGVPQLGLDLVSVGQRFTLSDYLQEARQIIDACARQKISVYVVGGTPLYVDALVYGFELPEEDLKLRQDLEARTFEKLAEIMHGLDKNAPPETFVTRRRLIRAIETVTLTKKSLQKAQKSRKKAIMPIFGLNSKRNNLYANIDKRVDDAIAKGMVTEIDLLIKSGVALATLLNMGLWVRLTVRYIQGELTETEYKQRLKYDTHAYARRQLTWWRRNADIKWFESGEDLVKELT